MIYNADLECRRLIWNGGRLTGSGRVTCAISRTIAQRSKSTFTVISLVFLACFVHNTHHASTSNRNILKLAGFIWWKCSLLLYQNGVCVDICRDSDRYTPETVTAGAGVMQMTTRGIRKPIGTLPVRHATPETTSFGRNSDFCWSGH